MEYPGHASHVVEETHDAGLARLTRGVLEIVHTQPGCCDGGTERSQAKRQVSVVSRHLFETIALLDVNPEDVLYVGDTTTDLETARAAEVDFVGYKRDEAWGRRLLAAGCDLLAEDLLEVAEMVLKPRE